MITLNGTVQRKFYFPGDPLTALVYFSRLSRVAYFLPHINVADIYDDDKVRIRYQTVELGAYTINIFCDLKSTTDIRKQEILIEPLEGYELTNPSATLNSTTSHGYYSSSAKLYAEDGGTGIDYHFQFRSDLPRPRGLRMMPKRVVDRIAQSISLGRVEEIAEGFMRNALGAFEDWQEDHGEEMIRRWVGELRNQEVEVTTGDAIEQGDR